MHDLIERGHCSFSLHVRLAAWQLCRMTSQSRRDFLATSALAGGALAFGAPVAIAAAAQRFPIIGFTKPFQKLSYDETAETAVQIGWEGVELPLRAKGQIEPERVEEELPKFCEALKKRGLQLSVVTTDIVNLSTPYAEKVLRTAKALGCNRYRLGFNRYQPDQSPITQLNELKPALRDLAAMNKAIGIQGGIQNHSGAQYVGCAIWDIFELVRDLDPQSLGICFDIGHATLEGGLSWPNEARLMEPWFTCAFVKDFAWAKDEKKGKGFVPKWGPLGEGMVKPEYFAWLKKSSYAGPVCLHVEYLEGWGPEQLVSVKKDCETLKGWLA
jgi:sugar phosphate isomerase/epimerase